MYTKDIAITDEWDTVEQIRARAESVLRKIMDNIDMANLIPNSSYYVCAGGLFLGDDCRSVLNDLQDEFTRRGYKVEVLEDIESLQTAAYYFSVRKIK